MDEVSAITVTTACAFKIHEMCKDIPPSMREWCECMCHEEEAIIEEIETL